MEESSSESQQRCPCGFWGSSKTLGLCSVCYRQAHRNQSQGGTHSADAGKPSVGACHNQSQNSPQGKRMDSRHFPSRSTTDNLPSSLSSPPSERASLSAASASPMDATTPTTSSGSTASPHMPTVMSAGGGDPVQPGSAAMTKPPCEPSPSPSDSDTCTSVSSDLSYDPKRDPGCCPSSDSCASLISVASSFAATLASSTSSACNEERTTKDSLATGIQGSNTSGILNAVAGSNSSTQSTSNATKTSPGPSADTVGSLNNTVVSSIKNSAAKLTEKGENPADSSATTETSTQASANVILPSTAASGSIGTAQIVDSIPTASDRGIKRSRDEMEASPAESPAISPQKNKKRCFICSCKLELAQRTIGRCRCDRVFCALHRLPELHDCDFNHKEDGRREAREKMIKPTRHLGPSYRREDHS